MSGNRSITPLKIIASGVALPENKIYSSMLDEKLNKPKVLLKNIQVSNIASMQVMSYSQAVLASLAIQNALHANHIVPSSIDMLINASAIPVQALPSAAHILEQSNLNQGIACFDVNSSCISFITALQVAAGY